MSVVWTPEEIRRYELTLPREIRESLPLSKKIVAWRQRSTREINKEELILQEKENSVSNKYTDTTDDRYESLGSLLELSIICGTFTVGLVITNIILFIIIILFG